MKRGLLEWKCWVKSFYNKCPTLQGPNGLKGLEQYSASHIWFWTFYILYNFDSLHTLAEHIVFWDGNEDSHSVLQLFPFIRLGLYIVKQFFLNEKICHENLSLRNFLRFGWNTTWWCNFVKTLFPSFKLKLICVSYTKNTVRSIFTCVQNNKRNAQVSNYVLCSCEKST